MAAMKVGLEIAHVVLHTPTGVRSKSLIDQEKSATGERIKKLAKMLGRSGHERQCDCNFEQHVSGAGEKCNYRYGNGRARSNEKRNWKQDQGV